MCLESDLGNCEDSSQGLSTFRPYISQVLGMSTSQFQSQLTFPVCLLLFSQFVVSVTLVPHHRKASRLSLLPLKPKKLTFRFLSPIWQANVSQVPWGTLATFLAQDGKKIPQTIKAFETSASIKILM